MSVTCSRTITRSSRPSRRTSSANGAKSAPARITSLNESRGRMRRGGLEQQVDPLERAQVRGVQDQRLVRHARARAAPPRASAAAGAARRSCGSRRSAGRSRAGAGSRRCRYADTVVTASEPVERVADRRPVARVAAEQGGVGAVQRRDHPRPLARAAASTARGSPPWRAARRSGRAGRRGRWSRLTSAIFTESGSV